MSALAPLSPAPYRRSRFTLRGARSLAFGVAIALVLAAMGYPLWPAVVQSVCISLCCWFAIDLGRRPLARFAHRHAPVGSPEAESHWPGWPLMMIAIVIGSLFGFTVGGKAANLILGRDVALGYFRSGWAGAVPLLLSSLIPGIAVTYWFYSREAIAQREAAMQAAQRQAAEHQLKLLESQLEPHMLFNTLANLRVLIGLDPPRAQAMLDQLIAFLRATLPGSRAAEHPLSAEFARLHDYLALMQIRMGERLQTRFELPEALAAVSVPPLLLQPLVENSIRHGLEPLDEGGLIEIVAARDGGMLLLRVRDTGAGLSTTPSDGTHFGLTQVRERLANLYGSAATFNLAAAPEGGVVATIRLPLPVDAPT